MRAMLSQMAPHRCSHDQQDSGRHNIVCRHCGQWLANGQVIKYNGSAWACGVDNDTTYTAGTGISFSGTTINNTGVLSATGTGAVTNTGTAQNPSLI